LLKGEKVRVVGRNACRLDRFVRKGAESFTLSVSDTSALTSALTRAFTGARAAYLMLPPGLTSPDYRADQERDSDAIAKAVQESGLRYAVNLSSFGAHVPAGTGPIAGLHSAEQKLNGVRELNVLHLRAGYFMENNFAAIGMIQGMGILGNALLPNLKLPMIATRDIGEYAAQRILKLDFSGQQTCELLGERDLSMNEATAIIARGVGKPDLRLCAISLRPGAAGARANGRPAEDRGFVHRDVQGHQRGNGGPGAALAGEHHTHCVREICAGCFCARLPRQSSNRVSIGRPRSEGLCYVSRFRHNTAA